METGPAAALAVVPSSSANNVASTSGGKIVTTQLLNVYQALDPSIIRSIDVIEGQKVEKGQKLATLDPTFAAADVQQLRLQIVALEAQIARDEAELDGRSLVYPPSNDRGCQQICGHEQGLLRATGRAI